MPKRAQPREPERLSPGALLNQHQAAAYVNCSRTTIIRYVRENKLSTVEYDGELRYRVRDLDTMKANLGRYSGKRGKPPKEREKNVQAAEQARVASIEDLSSDLMAGMGIDASTSEKEAQAILRKQILLMASKNKVVQRLFGMLDSPSESVRLQAISRIFNVTLPSLKSTEVKHSPDEEWKQVLVQMDSMIQTVKGEKVEDISSPNSLADCPNLLEILEVEENG